MILGEMLIMWNTKIKQRVKDWVVVINQDFILVATFIPWFRKVS